MMTKIEHAQRLMNKNT